MTSLVKPSDELLLLLERAVASVLGMAALVLWLLPLLVRLGNERVPIRCAFNS